MSLAEIHQEIEKLKQGEDFTIKEWTDKAVATEYKDSLDIEKTWRKKPNGLLVKKPLTDRQQKMDALRISVPDAPETDEDDEAT